ncbi:hypothetical protein QUB60_07725 [Microcoleus sp. A2-C5]|uniref:hypothetical protein n=1 Tax=Microcoleaceae TaxID=1892252 RepID=UPI002237A016|nr:hypothetical protein [Lyngbya sp. CCAP 1446/10]MCW6048622.1 hypothetical protein [Lyngbya sp. CCAP 1446/10]
MLEKKASPERLIFLEAGRSRSTTSHLHAQKWQARQLLATREPKTPKNVLAAFFR